MANERSASAAQPALGRDRGQPPVQQEPPRRAAAERRRRRDRRCRCASSRSCGPPRSSRSPGPSPAWSATTAPSPAATRSSGSTPRCGRPRGAATAPSAGSCSWPWRPSARPPICARSSAPTCSTTSRSSRASRCSPRAAGTSPSSASARSRRASPRCACWPRTSAGASSRRQAPRGGGPGRAPRLRSASPQDVLALGDDHDVPAPLLEDVRALLGA